MKKVALLWALMVGLVYPSVAQKDKKASEILDAMSKKYQSLNSYKATFSYAGEGGKYKGDLAVKKNAFRLKLAGQEVFTDGKTMSTYIKETNEVNVQDYDAGSSGEFNPTKIYSIYKQGYNYKYIGEQKQGGQPVDVVELTPEKKNTQITKVQIAVNKKDKSVKGWKLTDKSGKVTSYTIDSFTPNVAIADTYFVFDKSKYPGVEVVDLR
ncbi:outer membrane lipoprotein-sorting protein [Larkinella arboricola]|uniref:Outer membrane lipoprotein-sorting protein n=1 Tax=Larkinella arboricola TaxID=643671 RepID=A0A327WWF5_LARAB|nr:outer membrane lipoprotein carrier protein LolA [Larkinella arboricola]RAJ97647.1 outer membrane lipoprotein-sorting protein [Larkinella arboricola]